MLKSIHDLRALSEAIIVCPFSVLSFQKWLNCYTIAILKEFLECLCIINLNLRYDSHFWNWKFFVFAAWILFTHHFLEHCIELINKLASNFIDLNFFLSIDTLLPQRLFNKSFDYISLIRNNPKCLKSVSCRTSSERLALYMKTK